MFTCHRILNIYTRYKNEETILVEITDEWLAEVTWELPIYLTNEIPEGTTKVELLKLRNKLEGKNNIYFKKHLMFTYSKIIDKEGIVIDFNGKPLQKRNFENWSYPLNYEPRQIEGELTIDNQKVYYSLIGGLTKSRKEKSQENDENSPLSEYGVYFYCNDRLIKKSCKDP